MCQRLDTQSLSLYVRVKKEKLDNGSYELPFCQVVHIHNDYLAKFSILAVIKTTKDTYRVEEIAFHLVNFQEDLFLSLEKAEYDENIGKFYFELKPFVQPPKTTVKPWDPPGNFFMKSGDIFQNKVQFWVNGQLRDRLLEDGNVGDQACIFKII